MRNLNKKDYYNKIPVCYCKGCLSLKIREAGIGDLTYCDDCSSTNIGEASILEWDKMYVARYGFHYLNNNYNK